MKRKLVHVVFAAVLAAGMIWGCSNPSGSNDDAPAFLAVTAEGVSYNLRPVPGGTVTESISGSFANAGNDPVTVGGFFMGETEITYELWYAVKTWATGSGGYTFANNGREGDDGTTGASPTADKLEPVTQISWRDAVVWCNAYSEAAGKRPVYRYDGAVLRESEGSSVTAGNGKAENAVTDLTANGFRLPTEVQWEYAARGGNPGGSRWGYAYAGSNNPDAVAVYNVSSTAPVKTKAPNGLGLYDMSGNVWEFCQDASGDYRLIRGGSYNYGKAGVRVDYRNSYNLEAANSYYGFRVLCGN
ncbi:MAG: formylglycine-generating enzyme family protein [Treponema sp.]|jgi:formylglycine-generating enzyme required for sulfatase activity|nr:formylglycine-generating enzyme family protein [Treponema sp.]